MKSTLHFTFCEEFIFLRSESFKEVQSLSRGVISNRVQKVGNWLESNPKLPALRWILLCLLLHVCLLNLVTSLSVDWILFHDSKSYASGCFQFLNVVWKSWENSLQIPLRWNSNFNSNDFVTSILLVLPFPYHVPFRISSINARSSISLQSLPAPLYFCADSDHHSRSVRKSW